MLRWKWRAHPRSRGDHGSHSSIGENLGGSSPLARGPLLSGKPRAATRGLIPARAGTTRTHSGEPETGRAHPRSRGDHSG